MTEPNKVANSAMVLERTPESARSATDKSKRNRGCHKGKADKAKVGNGSEGSNFKVNTD
jgi:hypothetical protein